MLLLTMYYKDKVHGNRVLRVMQAQDRAGTEVYLCLGTSTEVTRTNRNVWVIKGLSSAGEMETSMGISNVKYQGLWGPGMRPSWNSEGERSLRREPEKERFRMGQPHEKLGPTLKTSKQRLHQGSRVRNDRPKLDCACVKLPDSRQDHR